MKRLLSLYAVLAALAAVSLRAASSATPAPSVATSVTLSGTNTFLSGSTVGFAAGSNMAISGALNGTPSGGTLNLSNLTLTLGTPTVTDTILGTSGPSIKSSIAARAPRQALVFDGTAGATITNVSAFGTEDWSIAIFGLAKAFGSQIDVCDVGSGIRCEAYFDSSGILKLYNGTANTITTTAVTAGKPFFAVLKREGGNLYGSINGGAFGAGVADSTNYTSAITKIGKNKDDLFPWNGTLEMMIFNRTLSIADVVFIYETGSVPPSDIGTFGSVAPSNTNLVGGAFSNYQYDSGTITGGATAAGFTAVETGGQTSQASSGSTGTFLGIAPIGARYRVAFSAALTSGAVPALSIQANSVGSASASYNVTNGANSFEIVTTAPLTAESGAGSGVIAFLTAGNTSYEISGFTVKRLGLIFAQDSSQSFDYQLLDVSGNKADITIPASGVRPAIPNVGGQRSVRAALTWSGSHEAKSVLGQIAIPASAQITSIVTEATAGSAGSGLTVGSVTTPALFVAANGYTTTKKLHTLAAVFPAGSATNDLSLVVDPDTQNYTGTINVTINYILTR